MKKLLKVAKHYYYLTSIWIKYWSLKTLFWISAHSRNIFRLIILATGIAIGGIFLLKSYEFYFDNGDLSNIYVGLGSMLGGILAIVFSFLTFTQENNDYLQGNIYYRKYIYGWSEKLCFLYISLLTLFFFLLSFLYSSESLTVASNWLISLSVILTTVAILAIDRLHEVTAYKSDPREALNYIHQQALMAIMRMKKDTELKAKYLQNINEKLDPRYSKSFSANVFNKTGLDGLSEYIISIIEISEILITKNQNSLVSYSIDVIQSILVHYLLFRKDSSIATPVFPFLSYESDSQQFLTKVFENIDELVKFAFVNDKERTIIKILDLYENVAIVSTEIDFDNIQLSQGNPITQVIVGYLHQLILKAKLNKQVEPLFQSARVLNNIAIVFLNKSLYFQIKSVTEYLDEISYQGMILRSDVLYNRAIEFQINLLPFLMKSDFGDVGIKSIIEDILKDIFETNLLLDKLNRPIFSYYSRLSPFTLHLGIKLEIMFQSALNTENEDSKEKINLLIFLEEYARYLRDYFSKNNSTSLVTPVANTIETINKYLLAWYKNEETSQIREQVKDVLKRYTYLPYWMIDKKIKLDYGKYYDLIEQTTIIGIKSKTEVIDNDLFETSVSALIAILRKFNHKDNVGRGYDEPKVALNLVFLGILALKNADEKEFIKIGLELLDFEKEYLAKYPEMLEKMSDFDELQLLKSIWSVRDDLFDRGFYRGAIIHEDPVDFLVEQTTKEDFDKFIFEIWRACDDRCSLKDEHELFYQGVSKKQLISNLIEIFKHKIDH